MYLSRDWGLWPESVPPLAIPLCLCFFGILCESHLLLGIKPHLIFSLTHQKLFFHWQRAYNLNSYEHIDICILYRVQLFIMPSCRVTAVARGILFSGFPYVCPIVRRR